jgi:hypothetical protein
MTLLKTWAAILATGTLGWATTVDAQVPLSTACQTGYGVCAAPVAPIGVPCTCFGGQRGHDPGRMIYIPQQHQQQMGGAPQLSNACATNFGVCPMPFQAPVGVNCVCNGPRGADPGRVVGGGR